jgi:hypothetical protein
MVRDAELEVKPTLGSGERKAPSILLSISAYMQKSSPQG